MILIMATIIAQGKMNHEGFGYFLTLSLRKTLGDLDEPPSSDEYPVTWLSFQGGDQMWQTFPRPCGTRPR